MANKENQNDYRAERKKRLAKSAKQNKKSGVDTVKLVTWIVRIITVAVVIGIAAFAIYQFGLPHKVLPAAKVGDRTYSVAEYGYYYSSVFQSYAEQSNTMYQNFGYAVFDPSGDPSQQTTTDEDGNKITYDELFRERVLTTLATTNHYLAKCEEEGVTLSEAHQEEIDTMLSQISATAAANGFSTSRYISLIYGKGMNEKMFVELLKEQYLVAQYIEDLEAECSSDISDEDLENAYAEAPADFQSVDLRLFGFDVKKVEGENKEETTTTTSETTTANEETTAEETTVAEETTSSEETTASEEETTAAEEKEPTKTELLAQEMLDRVKDEDSFMKLAYEYAAEDDKETFKDGSATLARNIKKSIVSSQIGEDLAEWLYSDERVVGDKTVYSTDNYVYVIYIIKTAYRVEEPLADARHILVSFESVVEGLKKQEDNKIDIEKKDDVEVKTTELDNGVTITNEGTGYSIELVTETYKAAQEIYDEFMKGDKTEEKFAELANKHSDDTGSAGENGNGGLIQGIQQGEMVLPFEEWVYDENRKTGDVDIIMTNYGWHIMYYVKQHDEAAWKAAARETLASEAFAEIEKEVEEAVEGNAVGAAFVNFAGNEACKMAAKLYS